MAPSRGQVALEPEDVHSREICPGGVEFETSSARGDVGAVLVANSTPPVMPGVSVLIDAAQ